jgi:hypothetical protein
LKKRSPAVFAALLEAIKRADLPLHEFMSQTFLDSVMYDVMWVPALVPIEAKVANKSVKAYLVHRTEWQANRDLNGAYKALLRLTSPEMALKAVPNIMVQMFNFGKPETKKILTGYHVVSFKGIPDVLEGWLMNAFRIYGYKVVDMAGGKVTDFHIDPAISEGVLNGVPVSTLTVNLSYEAK